MLYSSTQWIAGSFNTPGNWGITIKYKEACVYTIKRRKEEEHEELILQSVELHNYIEYQDVSQILPCLLRNQLIKWMNQKDIESVYNNVN